MQTQSNYSDTAESYTDTGTSSHPSSKSSISNSSDSSDFDLSKWTARNAEKAAYDRNVSLVIKILSGEDITNKKADIQRTMK